jgi:hypothetical protein
MYRMQGNNTQRKKRKVGDQLTLDGQVAFDPLKDYQVCKAKQWGREVHRAHHKLCFNNTRTKGITSQVTLDSMAESERLRKHFAKPMSAQEHYSSSNYTAATAAAFFAPKKKAPTTTATSNCISVAKQPPQPSMTIDTKSLYTEVCATVNSPLFCQEHNNNRAPLAMIVLARVVVDIK